ncbi:CDP-glycerol glycerophosphotransferase family protein [Alcaligenaceae bacterium]|nr:CDP-glycerol glycerophosphotransferase family protein [Alcaligenaceae bacterium]
MKWFDYLKAKNFEKKSQWKEAFKIYKKIAGNYKEVPSNLAYRIGFVSEKNKSWKIAEKWLIQAVQGQPNKALWVYRLALAQEMNKKFILAAETYQKALALDPNKAEWYYRFGKALWLAGKSADAEEPLRKAIEMKPRNATYAYELAIAIRKQGRTWQEVETLFQAVALQGSNAQWQFELGEALDKMNRLAEAAGAFGQANHLKPGNAMWHFREGWAWERAGERKYSEMAYAAAILADKELKAGALGIGVFHQKRGFWPQAVLAYEREVEAYPLNAELNYRLGLAHDRCYHWELAEASYREALVRASNEPAWHYRLAFVLERQGLWLLAAEAYEYAATTRPQLSTYWFYRLGYVLAKGERHEQACTAFLHTRTQAELGPQFLTHNVGMVEAQTALSHSYLEGLKVNLRARLAQDTALRSHDQASVFYKLGNQAERLQMWKEAAQAYQAAVDCGSNHNSLWYYRLGYVLEKMGRFQEACSAFVETRVFRQSHGVDMSRFKKNAGLMQRMEYTEFLETLPIKKKTILYESFLGSSLGCNPYAIYRELLDNPAFNDFTHIWVVTGEIRLPFDFPQRSNTLLIKRQSSAYRRYLTTAEYLINNVTFPSWFIRREGQKYLNTWHGTPLKALGKDMSAEFMMHGNVSRNFLHATHLLSPNEHTSNIMMKSYDIAGIFSGMLAETGYPRVDRLLNATEIKKYKIKKYLGLSNKLPIVLYAPTWRGTHRSIKTNVDKTLKILKKLSKKNYQLIFRGHHFEEQALRSVDIPVVAAGQEIDACDLLSIVDVLITDYSSIAFDFIPTKRPIIYYAYDLAEYSESRGLYFPLTEMPGSLCSSSGEVIKAIQISINSPEIYQRDERYNKALEAYSKFEDGKSTQRAIEFFFNDITNNVVHRYEDTRRITLFYNGQFRPNGITSSFLNLLQSIPKNENFIFIAIVPSRIKNDVGRLEKFSALPAGVQILPKEGQVLFTPEEAWLDNTLMKWRGLEEVAMEEAHNKIYQREFIRLYGLSNHIDNVINFEGYNGYWTHLFSQAGPQKNKITWLHSDMLEEFKIRMPFLTRNFSNYSLYNNLVSVSSMMNEINKQSLSNSFGINDENFVYCNNTINIDEIQRKAEEPLDHDLQKWFTGIVFLTIGRMSPEKDQAKLIRAFAQARKTIPGAKLIILGDGPLYKTLESLIAELNLQNTVLLAGQRSNPFPALKACDCFVLSSNHEGQPMVLLEALTLGKKIIATDIDGNRGILGQYEGVLVENSVEGLRNGIERYSEIDTPVFYGENSQRESVEKFMKIIDNKNLGG